MNIINTKITTTSLLSYKHNTRCIERHSQVNKKVRLLVETKVMNIMTSVTTNNLISMNDENVSFNHNDSTAINILYNNNSTVQKNKLLTEPQTTNIVTRESNNNLISTNSIKKSDNTNNNSLVSMESTSDDNNKCTNNKGNDRTYLKNRVSWKQPVFQIIPTDSTTSSKMSAVNIASKYIKIINPDKVIMVINKDNNNSGKHKLKWSIRNNNIDYHLSDLRDSSEEVIEHITQMVATYAPLLSERSITTGSSQPISDKKGLFREYLKELALIYGTGCLEAKAEKAAKELNIDPASLTKDLIELKEDGTGLLTFVKKRMEVNKAINLSGKSIQSVVPTSDEEYDKAYNIAENGVVITFDEQFNRQSTPVPLRPLQQRIPTTILALIVKLHKNNQGLIFRLKDISPDDQKLIHFSSLHWRGEYAKILGRLLFDLSNSDIEGFLRRYG